MNEVNDVIDKFKTLPEDKLLDVMTRWMMNHQKIIKSLAKKKKELIEKK